MPAAPAPTHSRAARTDMDLLHELAPYIAGQEEYRPLPEPDGWKWLTYGVTRYVLLGPDGWVYKIEYAAHVGINDVEAAVWTMAREHAEYRPLVPHFHTFDVKVTVRGLARRRTVIAVEPLVVDRERTRELFKGDSPERRALLDMAEHFGCDDLHGGNIGWRGDQPLLLDAGNGTKGYVDHRTGCPECNPEHEDWKGAP